VIQLPKFPLYLRLLWLSFLPLAALYTLSFLTLFYAGQVYRALAALLYASVAGLTLFTLAVILTGFWYIRVSDEDRR
jgi:hypothetical protein